MTKGVIIETFYAKRFAENNVSFLAQCGAPPHAPENPVRVYISLEKKESVL